MVTKGIKFFILAGIVGNYNRINCLKNRMRILKQKYSFVDVELSELVNASNCGEVEYNLEEAEKFLLAFYNKNIRGKSEGELPEQIYLIYRDIKLWPELLEKFSYFVFPVRVSCDDEYEKTIDEICSGRKRDALAVVESIKGVVDADTYKNRRYLMLPTQNFPPIEKILRDLFEEKVSFDAIDASFPEQGFYQHDVLRFERCRLTQQHAGDSLFFQGFYQHDVLRFERCRLTQQHAGDSLFFELDGNCKSVQPFRIKDVEYDNNDTKRALNGCYRFGVRYDPGFHFDVSILKEAGLHCFKREKPMLTLQQ